MRKLLLSILLLSAVTLQDDPIGPLFAIIEDLHGKAEILEETEGHMRIRMADSCYYDVHTSPEADSIIVIQTVCAPICSSCVRVYNKEWELRNTPRPTCGGIFPEAEFRDGQIIWHDNTPEYLDDEEKKRLE